MNNELHKIKIQFKIKMALKQAGDLSWSPFQKEAQQTI